MLMRLKKNNVHYPPNELWLGEFEKKCLELYINKNKDIFYIGQEHQAIDKNEKFECMGLKVRFTDQVSRLEVMHNPHYE